MRKYRLGVSADSERRKLKDGYGIGRNVDCEVNPYVRERNPAIPEYFHESPLKPPMSRKRMGLDERWMRDSRMAYTSRSDVLQLFGCVGRQSSSVGIANSSREGKVRTSKMGEIEHSLR